MPSLTNCTTGILGCQAHAPRVPRMDHLVFAPEAMPPGTDEVALKCRKVTRPEVYACSRG
jgi:hypothetical protein